ncbi:MAG: triose-phosphate isomerase [Actinomycetota bacterium]|nr:triose-phosphate isomerase [Actinomycetota bacterium]
MNLNHLEAIALVQKLAFTLSAEQLAAAEVVVLPPFVDLRSVQTLVDGDKVALGYGAQDLSPHPFGAYTGDVSGAMLAKLGCTYVIVGHSERRQHHGETDELVNAKTRAAFAHGLVPIVCLGEGPEVRHAGEHIAHCRSQLEAALAAVTAEQAARMVLAYEPLWAIGTGETATPEDAKEMAAALRTTMSRLYDAGVAATVRVLYGGSVKPEHAEALAARARPDVDGVLVGGASLDAEQFAAICVGLGA